MKLWTCLHDVQLREDEEDDIICKHGEWSVVTTLRLRPIKHNSLGQLAQPSGAPFGGLGLLLRQNSLLGLLPKTVFGRLIN